MSRSREIAILLAAAVIGGASFAAAQSAKPAGKEPQAKPAGKETPAKTAAAPAVAAAPAKVHYGIGREAKPEEIAGWDIDVRPDGQGLPPGKGTARKGEELFVTQCAACHGEFGESAGRWPVLAGGAGSLASHDPVKTIGSYWPYASTVIDYVRRAMPFGNAQSLEGDDLYSIVAYVLYLNDVITDQDQELSDKSFPTVKLANEANFFDDDREVSEKAFWKKDPCMTNCVAGAPKILGRARAIDVTPEDGKGPRVE
ncbi:cytochrome c [Rhodoplanes sp. TEM]|uniref:Cytochrome c n=1 Tax=Rhodoplanes tepidamans TaxID=200616 RepID=A0ABT5JK20_RHOTP|nr:MULTISPECIES: cytochrome c [Rhodoplanes]MDC7789941.1 cytochrome c [Rhodoplanes tepidamans]MDC7986778.1 cytochrome c [Rhodoplanes sp. TEM]MDQ0357742.1 cytochrome c [Rhodoplanes tepidamans]